MDAISVTHFNRTIASHLKSLRTVFLVKGEISQVKNSSGNYYISLKDEFSSVEVAYFRNRIYPGSYIPVYGDEVLVSGTANLYEKTGRFSLVADAIRKTGMGDILEKLRLLKEEWRTTYFAKPKRPIPSDVRNLLVVTSAEGAVIHDIIRTRNIRDKRVNILILPSLSQGDGCAQSVSDNVRLANDLVTRAAAGERIEGLRSADFNSSALIVARGGGSFEDLLPFSSEPVVKSFFESKLVVISSIGHESDTPLCDYAADVRASTPTQAVELAVEPLRARRENLRGRQQIFLNCIRNFSDAVNSSFAISAQRFASSRKEFMVAQGRRLDGLISRFRFAKAGIGSRANMDLDRCKSRFNSLLRDFSASQFKRLSSLRARFSLALGGTCSAHVFEIRRLSDRLRAAMRLESGKRRDRIALLARSLEHLSPFNVLARGYSIVCGSDGKVISSPADIAAGEKYELVFKDENRVKVRISEVEHVCEKHQERRRI